MLYRALKTFRPNFLKNEIEKLLSASKSVLDVGCGSDSLLQYIKNIPGRVVGMDLFQNSIEKSKEKKIHKEYFLADASSCADLFDKGSFDCVMAIDLIEHLEKANAIDLMKKMEYVAKKLVIVQTTNGYVSQDAHEGNTYQTHKCGFSVRELYDLGYTVLGMDGPKFLRKEQAKIKFKPVILFSVLATTLDPVFRKIPNQSFNLLAYKYVEK